MSESVSTLRLYLLRFAYLLNFLMLGLDVWPAIIGHQGPWDPVRGAAFSFWAALSLLSGLGLRYPVKMLPLLLLQFAYKIVWILAVALPVWSRGESTGLDTAFVVGAVLDLIVIPWPLVLALYIRTRGERWKSNLASK